MREENIKNSNQGNFPLCTAVHTSVRKIIYNGDIFPLMTTSTPHIAPAPAPATARWSGQGQGGDKLVTAQPRLASAGLAWPHLSSLSI